MNFMSFFACAVFGELKHLSKATHLLNSSLFDLLSFRLVHGCYGFLIGNVKAPEIILVAKFDLVVISFLLVTDCAVSCIPVAFSAGLISSLFP